MDRTGRSVAVIGILALLGAMPAWAAGPSPASGSFATAGALIEARGSHTATLLPDGRVLVVGGNADSSSPSGYLATAELWDPRTGTSSAAGLLPEARTAHTATLLPDGRVLIVGGLGSRVAGAHGLFADAELWDPATETFEPAGSLAEPRWFHTATLLADGSVLVVGGLGREHLLADAEVWDPISRSFHATGPLLEARSLHTATLLDDGRVLVVGGYDPVWGTPVHGSTELWDPATGSFLPTGPLAEQRSDHTATLLLDGRVLVVGGETLAPLRMLDSVEAWDPTAESSSAAGGLIEGRADHTATLLPDGGVLVIGGVRDDGGDRTPMATAERRDPDTETFQLTGPMALARRAHTATLLPDGRVIVIGGFSGPGHTGVALASAEVWTP